MACWWHSIAIKGSTLLLEAHILRSEMYWIWIAIVAGPCFGSLKREFIFSKSCQNNLARIRSLDQPKVWQIFRPLVLCILSCHDYDWCNPVQLAHGNYYFLIGVAIWISVLLSPCYGAVISSGNKKHCKIISTFSLKPNQSRYSSHLLSSKCPS
jgi:hypothetical protein